MEKKVYLVSTAHLDTVWQWTLADTIEQYIPATVDQNEALFAEFPAYKFSFETAFHYHLLKEYYPKRYEKVKKWIEEGRWIVAGSAWVAGDVNIPSPESLIRQFLYGNGFYKQEFGVTSNDVFLPDCFGFGYALPSIAAHCGLTAFSTQKLQWGCAYGVPFDLGKWVGIDGNYLIASLKPGSYVEGIGGNITEEDAILEKLSENTVPKTMRYYGVGDRGGAVHRHSVLNAMRSIANPQHEISPIFAGSGQFASEMTDEEIKRLPVYDGELIMSTHAVGGYTAVSPVKRYTRLCEQGADAAERVSVLAEWASGLEYPAEQLDSIWKRFLWHQFHDDLPGTSLPEVYTSSYNDYTICLNQLDQLLTAGLSGIAQAMDTRAKEGISIAVFNGIAAKREDLTTVSISFSTEPPQFVAVTAPDGNIVPSQIIARSSNKLTIVFLASFEGLGCKIYTVSPSEAPAKNDAMKAEASTLENEYLRLTINENGDIENIYNKETASYAFAAPSRLALLSDASTEAYPAWEMTYQDIMAEPYAYVSNVIEKEVVRDGAAVVALRIVRKYRKSMFLQTISLASHSRLVRVDNTVLWEEKETMLKASFHPACSSGTAVYDLGLGVIERQTNTESLYEVPAQQWADMGGLTIVNDCKYGWDKPSDDTLRLTLLHTPKYPRTFDDPLGKYTNSRQNLIDLGENQFSYGILPHEGDWKAARSQWEAACFNQPLTALAVPAHNGPLGKDFCFVKINTPQVMLKALKKAQDSNAYILRFFECYGQKSEDVTVTFACNPTDACQVNGMEEVLESAVVKGNTLRFCIDAFAPKSFALTFEGDSSSQQQLNYQFLPLHKNCITTNQNRQEADGFGLDNTSIPRELMPSLITMGGISYKISGSNENTLSCMGQEIRLTEGCKKVHLLAFTASKDCKVSFLLGRKSQAITIHNFQEPLGGWEQRALSTYRFEKKDANVAYVASHSHTNRGDAIDRPFYLFHYCLKVPDDATVPLTLRFPDAPCVHVLAVTTES